MHLQLICHEFTSQPLLVKLYFALQSTIYIFLVTSIYHAGRFVKDRALLRRYFA